MSKDDLFKELKNIVANGVTKGEIEKAAGISRNSLSGILEGYKPCAKKRLTALEVYVVNYRRRRVTFVECADGTWETAEGKKGRFVWDGEDVPDASDLLAKEKEREELRRQIGEIRSEKIPSHRDTPLGRPVWQKEQENKIRYIEIKLIAK